MHGAFAPCLRATSKTVSKCSEISAVKLFSLSCISSRFNTRSIRLLSQCRHQQSETSLHPTLELIRERYSKRSLPGARWDGYKLGLVVEVSSEEAFSRRVNGISGLMCSYHLFDPSCFGWLCLGQSPRPCPPSSFFLISFVLSYRGLLRSFSGKMC
jgi:hypothetical protein